jgi:hypothetical protein
MASPLCPYCRSEVQLDDCFKCDRCGNLYHRDCFAESQGCVLAGCSSTEPLLPITPQLVNEPVGSPETSQKTKFCVKCGNSLAATAKFCTGCGAATRSGDSNLPTIEASTPDVANSELRSEPVPEPIQPMSSTSVSPSQATAPSGVIENLKSVAEMHRQGLLNDAEFENLKRKILGE